MTIDISKTGINQIVVSEAELPAAFEGLRAAMVGATGKDITFNSIVPFQVYGAPGSSPIIKFIIIYEVS